MRNLKLILILLLMIVLMAFILPVQAQTEVYNWKMVSAELAGDPMTVFAERYAKLVEEKSEGRIKIEEIFTYGSLGGERDMVELVQMGEIELGSIDYGWLGGFVPEAQVFALQYLWPKDNVEKVIHEVAKNGKFFPIMQEGFRKRGFQLLGVWAESWQAFNSNKLILTPEDTKGVKLRVMENPILISAYNNYGFNTITLDYGENYGALQTKLIDARIGSADAGYNMGFYEVTTHLISPWSDLFVCLPVINREVYDKLPDDLQQILMEACEELIEPITLWSFNRDEEFKEAIKEAKPTFTFYEYSDEEMMPFKELAWKEDGPVKTYLKLGGENAQELLDKLLADIKAAVDKYN